MAGELQNQTQQQDPEPCKDCEVQPTPASSGPSSSPNALTTVSLITASTVIGTPSDLKLPRVAITFCTQCKWLLRAAYFGQELLSTFGSAIGEIALIPATGGLFQVNVTHVAAGEEGTGSTGAVKEILLWDRKTRGGFPETKVLKQLLRDVIEPGKGLGHSDAPGKGKGKGKGKEDERVGDAGKLVKDPLVQTADSGVEIAKAASTLSQSPAGASVASGDDSSNDKTSLRTPAASTVPAAIDPLLEDANATPVMVEPTSVNNALSSPTPHLSSLTIAASTQRHPIDPLLQTAITSPVLEIEESKTLLVEEKREAAQPLSVFAQEAHGTANVPTTWEDEGIPP